MSRIRKVDPVDVILAGAILCFVAPFITDLSAAAVVIVTSGAAAVAAKLYAGS